MISTSSRYNNQPVTYYLDGRTQTTRPTVMRGSTFSPSAYQVKTSIRWQQGARVDMMSGKLYGDPDKWWILMDENPEILDPMAIEAGSIVVIP